MQRKLQKDSDQYWVSKNRYYYDSLASFYRFFIPKGSSVLAIGCRSGYLLNKVQPSFGVGVEKDGSFVEEAKALYPSLDFVVGGLQELTTRYSNEKFDYIMLPHTLMKEYDIQLFLEGLKKFCKEDTRILLNICSNFWEPILKLGQMLGLRRSEDFKNWISIADLENFFHLTDFEVVYRDHRTLLPKNIPLLSWVVNKFLANIPLVRLLCLDQVMVARVKPKVRDQSDMTLSVIIPCRNEKGNIEPAMRRMSKLGKKVEVVFVEGHSKDGTLDEIKRVCELYKDHEFFSTKYLVQSGKGKGNAVREGFREATGDVLSILDADLTMPPEELGKFWKALVEGRGELINGVRLIYSMESGAMRFLNLVANKLFSLGFSYVLNQRIRDTLCGTKVLTKTSWEKIEKGREFFGNFDPFGDFDLIFGAAKQGLKIVDMPIHYKDRTYGSTQISRFRHGLLLLRMSFFAFRKFKMW